MTPIPSSSDPSSRRISDSHAARIMSSAISDDVRGERCYFSVARKVDLVLKRVAAIGSANTCSMPAEQSSRQPAPQLMGCDGDCAEQLKRSRRGVGSPRPV
jgi:hypothetical protein